MSDELTRLGRELLPARRETLLLRACAGPPSAAAAAWKEWCSGVPDPAAALAQAGGPTRSLAPLLDLRLRVGGAEVADELRASLRASATRERERVAVLRAGAAEALGALGVAGVDVTLTGGFAVAETAYPEPGLRHCHDVDVLIARGARKPAARALGGRGGQARTPVHRGRLVVDHPLGAPVALHEKLFMLPGPRPPIEAMLARRQEVDVSGAAARALAPDDLMLQVVARGLCDVPAGFLRWAADAAEIARGPLDWERLADTAAVSGLAGLVGIGLGYLRGELGLAVPGSATRPPSRTDLDLVRIAALRRRRWAGEWRREAARPANALALARWAPSYLREKAGEQR